MRRAIGGFALAILLVGEPAPARAEPWLVVPVVVGDNEDAQLAGARARDAMVEALSSQVRVVPPGDARERFEAAGSAPPVAATHSDLDAIAHHAQKALYHTASGLVRRASQDVEKLIEHADGALESLNREARAARQLLDACMYVVRGLLDGGQKEAARARALECRRLVPDLEPSADMHPPHVIGEYAAARAALAREKAGSLRVTSEPSGCPLFVQGRKLGRTPLDLPKLSRGDYRLQVECVPGEFGRVHRVTLGRSHVVVHVDARFDAAVHTGDGVALRYAKASARREHALADAVRVGRIVGASHVAVLLPDERDAGVVRAIALETRSGEAAAQVAVGVSPEGAVADARQAAEALFAGRSVDLTGASPAPLEAPAGPEIASAVATAEPGHDGEGAPPPDLSLLDEAPADDGPTALAWTVGAVGVAAHVTGWALYARHLQLEDDYRAVRELSDTSEARRRLARVEDFELLPPLVAGAGAAVTAASLPWLLPDAAGVPGWAWGVGAAGLAVAGVGTAFLIQGASCDEFDRLGRCDDALATTRLGAMLLTTSAGLLGVPATYAVRALTDSPHHTVEVQATPSALRLHWRASL